ncbi:MAG: ankyrin repeat domain-containing protein [Geminicoccales bacterium]
MSDVQDLYQAIDDNAIERALKLLARDGGLADSTEETPPPVHWAIYRDNAAMVELLLDHGACIERKDQDRDATPLDYAIVYCRKDIIRRLICRGANVEGRMDLARRGASGAFEGFDELPSRDTYEDVVQIIDELATEGSTG